MLRIVIDTNIYVDWLNERRHDALLFQRQVVKHLSAIVLMELHAGAFSRRDQKALGELAAAFTKTNRVLLPTAAVYEDAGRVLRKLQTSFGYDLAGAHSLANDVLIALSARSIGATVATQSRRDFSAIQRVRRFDAIFVES